MGESSKEKKRHFCTLCPKDYAYRSGLRRHMRMVHENVAPNNAFKCQKCQNSFASARSLGAHTVSCSRPTTTSTIFKCRRQDCSNAYTTKWGRNRHEINCCNTTYGVSTCRQPDQNTGGGFNVQFGGGRKAKAKWRVQKIRQCLNCAVTYRATPNIEINTIGGLHHAMQTLKTIIIDRFKKFHGVKIHFNVEGTSSCVSFVVFGGAVGIVSFSEKNVFSTL